MTTTIAVVGTDTGCGKTALTAALAGALRRRGRSVGALKPLATGVPAGAAGEDAELLAAAVGSRPEDCVVSTFAAPRAPIVAARAEGRSIDVPALLGQIRDRIAASGADVVLVEGVGGVLVPIGEGVTVRDLVRELGCPVLVAARAGLGTINHTALTVDACRAAGIDVLGVALVDVAGEADADLVEGNAEEIAAQCGLPVLGVLRHLDDPRDVAALADAALADLDIDALEARVGALRGDGGAEATRLDRSHLWHPFTQTSEWLAEDVLVVRSGHGCRIRTADGRELVDGIGALWANVHGYAHPGIDRAVAEQLGRVGHATLLGQTHEPAARLAAELAAVTPTGLTRVFLGESGASAVEVAIRVALLAQRHRGEEGRTRFLTLADAYHGDTAGAVSLGRTDPFHRGLDPILFDAVRLTPPHLLRVGDGAGDAAAEAASLAGLDALLGRWGHTLAALVVEPRVQGAAGIWPHSDAWLRAVVDRCRAAGALIVCDEVATGFGRTGDLFASGGAGVEPDILCLGKGLSGGYLPISATVVGEELFDLFTGRFDEHRTLYYGHTFTGNPLACAAALASLGAFRTEATLERGRALAAHLGVRLAEVAGLPGVAEVRQRGVMCGIELASGGLAEPYPSEWRVGRQVTLAARRLGVVVRPLGDVVVLNPALTMPLSDADRLVDALAAAIAATVAALPVPAAPGR